MAFKMKGFSGFKSSPSKQKPKPRKGDVYVGPKPTIKVDGKEVPNPNYVKGDEFKMSDKPMYKGHKPSTHLMAYGESDGKYVAFPTLFQDDSGMWSEGGFKEAKEKGEVYRFDTEKEAADFAGGSWKNR